MTAGGRRGRPGLRARLVAFFVLTTVVPLAIALLLLQGEIGRQVEARAGGELEAVRRSVVALVDARVARAGDLANDLTQELVEIDLEPLMSEDEDDASEWLSAAAAAQVPDRADLVVLVGADAQVLASVHTEPMFAEGTAVEIADLGEAVRDQTVPPGVLLEVSEVRGRVQGEEERTLGWIVAGVWADARLLAGLGLAGNTAILGPDGVIAVVGVDLGALEETAATTGDVVPTTVGGEPVLATTAPLGSSDPDASTRFVVWSSRPAPSSLLIIILVVLLPATVLAAMIAWWLASTVVAPVRRAAEAARAVAAGDLGRQLEPSGGAELEDLAGAFNTMSADLSQRLDELSRSRDELRSSLDRLGVTLSSNLDLNRLLGVIVETGMDTLIADRGLLMLFTPERDALYTKVGRGLGSAEPVPRLPVGAGRIGHVAQTGRPVRLPHDAGNLPPPEPQEPSGEAQVLVPLLGRGRVLGVLSLLRDEPDRPFSSDDLETIRSFAAQASVAMENVMLHQEAQRLSVTDALTGLWNFRYFQLQAGREIEAATRFERPLSLVIIDIDFFKRVNDEYGHQVGDEVLVEFARRLRDTMRVPDVVARYGGEEFVVLLPGTGQQGAIATGERIREGIGEEAFTVTVAGAADRVPPLHITCSVGVSSFPEHGPTVASLLRAADSAMYAAKHAGRDRVVGAEPVPDLDVVEGS